MSTRNLMVYLMWDLIFNSEDEDGDDNIESTRRRVAKNNNYFEKIIPRFDGHQFKVHFRLSSTTYEKLLRDILHMGVDNRVVRCGKPNIALEKKLLIAVWYLSNTECFRSVGDRFGVSIKLAWSAVTLICDMLLRLNREKKIICWPDDYSALITANYCHNKVGFPGVIGFIDGTHIPIAAPKINPNSYINRKNFHSVLLQAVCNERMVFTDCYTGEVGSIHDACLFRRSNLYKKITRGSLRIPVDQHILGDQAYPLKSYLMVSFKDNGHLNDDQKRFNQKLSSIRVTIERGFGLLKNRFRRLQRLSTRKLEHIPLIIMAGCILHNICLIQNDWFEVPDFNVESNSDEDASSSTLRPTDEPAERKRFHIMDQL